MSMINSVGRLADIHLHLYGSIHPQDYLRFVQGRDVDWSSYEAAYNEAYGETPEIRRILKEYNLGTRGSQEEFRRLFVFGDQDAGNFARFQAKYNLLVSGSRWSRLCVEDSGFPDLIDEVCRFIHQIIARQRRQNIGYAEQRMMLNPQLTRPQARQLLSAMLEAYSRYDGSDIQPRLAISLPRENPWPDWEVTKEVALGDYGRYLTGIDFCYLEEGHPPKQQQELFKAVKEFNRIHPERALAILYHVGESFNDKSLESAIRWVHEAAELGVHRLGHAIALGVDPDRYGIHSRHETAAERADQLTYDLRHAKGLGESGLTIDVQGTTEELQLLQTLPKERTLRVDYDDQRLNELRTRQKYAIQCIRSLGSVIEVCPTSNRRIGGISRNEHHPLIQFVAQDAPFVVASDDPGIFDTTVADEVESAIAIAGLGQEHYDEIVERSWRYRSEVLTGRNI